MSTILIVSVSVVYDILAALYYTVKYCVLYWNVSWSEFHSILLVHMYSNLHRRTPHGANHPTTSCSWKDFVLTCTIESLFPQSCSIRKLCHKTLGYKDSLIRYLSTLYGLEKYINFFTSNFLEFLNLFFEQLLWNFYNFFLF
jgi:hypothetical protein